MGAGPVPLLETPLGRLGVQTDEQGGRAAARPGLWEAVSAPVWELKGPIKNDTQLFIIIERFPARLEGIETIPPRNSTRFWISIWSREIPVNLVILSQTVPCPADVFQDRV